MHVICGAEEETNFIMKIYAPKWITMHVNSRAGEETNLITNISAPTGCIAMHVNSGVDVGVGWIEKIN